MSTHMLHFYGTSSEQFKDDFLSELKEELKAFYSSSSDSKDFEEELLTVEETQGVFQCSKQALWNWRKAGILPSYRLGNRIYYKRSDIDQKLLKLS